MKDYRVNARLDEQSYKALVRIMNYLNCGMSQAVRSALRRVDSEFFHKAVSKEKK